MENNYKNKSSLEEIIVKKFDAIYNCFLKIDLIKNANSDSKKEKAKNYIPKLWNMDTKILTILDNFYINIKDVGSLNDDNYKLNLVANKKRFLLMFNDKNVTPSTRQNKNNVAKSTMSQYLRTLSFFKVIIIKNDYELKEFLKNKQENKIFDILLSQEFKLICNSDGVDGWMSLGIIYDFILKGIKCIYEDIMDMAFSFFVCATYFFDKENKIIFNDENDNKWSSIQFKKNKKIGNKYYNNESGKFKIIGKCLKETYINLVEKTQELIIENHNINNYEKNYNNLILDKFLDDILFLIMDKNINGFVEKINFDVTKEFTEIIKLSNEINNCKQKLRENILKSRNKNNEPYYSDIESNSSEFNYLPDAIEQMEAAHIFPVSEIKLRIKNNPKDKEEYLEKLSNKDNGIIIDHVYHDAFDKNWLLLDYNGVFQPTNEWNKRYVIDGKTYKHGLVKIKNDVFNDEMKYFISLRNNNNLG